MEVKLNNRLANIEILASKGSDYTIKVDDKEYKADIIEVERGVYSIIINHQSFNVELVNGSNPRSFTVNTYHSSYEAEVIDAEEKYRQSRSKGLKGHQSNVIESPMPGKVVKLFVSEGDQVEAGQTLIIISAMKMESEFKAPISGRVIRITTSEGSTVEGKQPLIIIE